MQIPKKIFRAKIVADFDTSYNRAWIYDRFVDDDTLRTLSNSQSERRINLSIKEEFENHISYLNFYEIPGYYLDNISDALLIGGGAYVYPAYIGSTHPEIHLDVVEIDQELINVAKKYFGYIESNQVTNHFVDGRVFLNENQNKYDVIYLDAYRNGDAIPFQLATQEAYQKIHNSLRTDGIFLVNIIGTLEGIDSRLLHSQVKTITSVFDGIKIFPVSTENKNKRQNIIIIATKGSIAENLQKPSSWMQQILSQEVQVSNISTQDNWSIMTDNYAPLEYYDLQHYL